MTKKPMSNKMKASSPWCLQTNNNSEISLDFVGNKWSFAVVTKFEILSKTVNDYMET